MLSNLAYTSNETLFLEKCIKWYRGKLSSSATSKSQLMRVLRKEKEKEENVIKERRKIVLSDEYYRRIFTSPEMHKSLN
jgi:hypothetical protein